MKGVNMPEPKDEKVVVAGADQNNKVDDNQTVDLSKLSDDQFSKLFDDERVWKHPRFKQLSDEAKTGRQLKKQQEQAEAKKLEEQGEFKKLLEQEREKTKEATLALQIQAAAQKAGAVDLEAVTKLLNRNAIIYNEDGTINGVDEAVTALLESKPYLKAGEANVTPSVGSGTNPGSGTTPGKYKFTHSQITDPKFYQEHEAEISEAMKNNQIENDLA